MEIWKDIKNYEGLYQISNLGNIKSLDRKIKGKNGMTNTKFGKEIKARLNEKGYLKASLCVNNKPKAFKVHRLVAINFIPNFENKKEVNHIDGNKLNNHVSNLEWVTRLENMRHGYSMGLFNNSIKIGSDNGRSKKVLNTATGKIYESISEAAKSINMKTPTLQAKLSGKNKNDSPLRLYFANNELVVNQKMN